ncbi:MAG: hypothetical protein HY226_04120 [Candidatus Vogelbacteria bacterium]|nr:hypothetical protein [Candidatus Vogelbacteria bacterium]
MIDKNGNPSADVPVDGSIAVFFRARTKIKDVEDILKQSGCRLTVYFTVGTDLCCHVNVVVGSEDAFVVKFRAMPEVVKSDRIYLQGYL